MTSRVSSDVAIVGFGPVGATLANLLGRDGVTATVLERATDVYQLPRAAHFDGEVMRIFQSAGLSDAILPATATMPGMDFVAGDGRRLLRFDVGDHRPLDGWARTFMFHQPDLERALRRGVERFPVVRVCLGTEVTGIADDGDGVTVTARHLGDGGTVEVRSRFLVGCDGARSTVRRHAGVALEDLRFDQPWLVLDTVLRDGARPSLPDRAVQYCDPSRPATFVPSAGRHRRWEFMVLEGEDPTLAESPENVARLLAPWVEVGRDVDVIRSAVYRFHALLADRWRTGRTFLAGDACHQMPPFLGQGMCSGIRDVANLSWKLGAVLDGLAGPELLDTYQPERAPHVRAIAELAVQMGGIISTTDPELAAVRDATMAADTAPAPVDLPQARLAFCHGDHALVGTRWPQPHVGDDLALGDRFAIVGEAAGQVDVGATLRRWVRVAAGTCDPLGPGEAALVRPDRFIAAAGDPASVSRAIRELLPKGTP